MVELDVIRRAEVKTCPRCGKGFQCQADAPSNCQCSSVVLNQAQRTRLGELHHDCLCIECLKEFGDDQRLLAAQMRRSD